MRYLRVETNAENTQTIRPWLITADSNRKKKGTFVGNDSLRTNSQAHTKQRECKKSYHVRSINSQLNVPEFCVLCSSHQESHSHFFFSCSFTKEIWQTFAFGCATRNPFPFPRYPGFLAAPFNRELEDKSHSSEAYAAGHSLCSLERKK